MSVKAIAAFTILLASSALADESFTPQQICRAAIATIMHKDVRIVSASGESTISIKYTSDGLKAFKCRIQGDRVMWGNADGRWRDSAYDEKVIWRVEDDALIISQPWSDGSISEDKFDRSELE